MCFLLFFDRDERVLEMKQMWKNEEKLEMTYLVGSSFQANSKAPFLGIEALKALICCHTMALRHSFVVEIPKLYVYILI